MKVVLRKDVEKLGDQDSVVNVSLGYARNFLLPRGLAVPVTKDELAAVEKRKAKKEKELDARRAEFEELAKKLAALDITIKAEAGEGGKLFGSITSQDIALAIKESSSLDVDKKKIMLPDLIKTVGEHKVLIKIYKEISADLIVKVEAK